MSVLITSYAVVPAIFACELLYDYFVKIAYMDIVIPLGGTGERFRECGYKEPKPLITVFDKPMINYVLDCIMPNIVIPEDRVYILYHEQLDVYNFSTYVKSLYPYVNLIQLPKKSRGAAETVFMCMDKFLTNHMRPCLLMDCDTFYTCDIINKAKQAKTNAVFYFREQTKNSSAIYSYDIFDNKNGRLTDICEKQKISNCANSGAYYFINPNELKDYCNRIIYKNKRFNNEFYTSCVIKEMVDDNIYWEGIELDTSTVKMIGTPKQLLEYMNQTYLFLFDLDGTLVQTDHIYYDVWLQILLEYNIELSKSMFETKIKGKNDATVFDALLPNITEETRTHLTQIKNTGFNDRIHEVTEINGAFAFIKSLKKRGHKVGIVTNCNRPTAESILYHFKQDRYVDKLVIANECKRAKPFPDPYKTAMEYFQISKTKTIIFEDSESGILSAQGVKPWKLFGILNPNTNFESLGVTHVISDYSNITAHDIIADSSNGILLPNLRAMIHSCLKKNMNINDVVVHDTKLKGGFIADIIRVDLVLADLHTVPCVVKMCSHDVGPMGTMASILQLHEREVYFYDTIQKYVNVKFPKCYGFVYDNNFDIFGIVLEDLNNEHYELALDLNKEPLSVSLKIIERMADLHAKFWNKDLKRILPLLKKNDDPQFNPMWPDFIRTNWNVFLQRWSHCLTTKQVMIGSTIVEKFSVVQSILSTGHLTMCHGDLKSANTFYKKQLDGNYEPYFIDWQYVVHGKGVQDLAFFIIESFDAPMAKKYCDMFSIYYYSKLKELGIAYDKNEFDKDMLAAVCYFPFFVAIWFGTTDRRYLLDVNFPAIFILKYFAFLQHYTTLERLQEL